MKKGGKGKTLKGKGSRSTASTKKTTSPNLKAPLACNGPYK